MKFKNSVAVVSGVRLLRQGTAYRILRELGEAVSGDEAMKIFSTSLVMSVKVNTYCGFPSVRDERFVLCFKPVGLKGVQGLFGKHLSRSFVKTYDRAEELEAILVDRLKARIFTEEELGYEGLIDYVTGKLKRGRRENETGGSE